MMKSKHAKINAEAAKKYRQEKKHAFTDAPSPGARQILVNYHYDKRREIDKR
jgi:hypothetical protein